MLSFFIGQATAMNIHEVEEGAAAMTKYVNIGIEGVKQTERIRFFQYAAVMHGFLLGVNGVNANDPNFELRPSHLPEKWMFDPEASAKSLSEFIKIHVPKTFDKDGDNVTDLYFLLWAWYYTSHSKSTRLDKALAADYLLLFTPDGRNELEIEKKTKEVLPKNPSE